MDEEPNPIKDILYEEISNIGEDKIQKEIANKNTSNIIKKITIPCIEKIKRIEGTYQTNLAKFQTSILHYLLTLVMIPSQRKITMNNIEIDIVIPDSRTLKNEPKNSIIISIPETHEQNICEQIDSLKSIQPNVDNIWCVTEQNIDQKRYSINDDSFFGIIEDIEKFLSKTKSRQFRFFKA